MHRKPDPSEIARRDQQVNQVHQQRSREDQRWHDRQRQLKALRRKVEELERDVRSGSQGGAERKELKKQGEAKSQQLIKLVKQWTELGGKMENAHLKGGGELVSIMIVLIAVGRALLPRAQALLAGLREWTGAEDRTLRRVEDIDREVKRLSV
jgi:hypothetical protein